MKRSKPRLTAQTFWLISSLCLLFIACQGDTSSSTDATSTDAASDSADVAPNVDGQVGDVAVPAPDSHIPADADGPVDGTTAIDASIPEDMGTAEDVSTARDGATAADGAVDVGTDGDMGIADAAANDAAPVVPLDAGPGLNPDAAIVDPDAAPPLDAAAPVVDMMNGPGAYPAGPYGVAIGQVISDLEFTDWRDRPYHLSDMRAEPDTRLIAIVNLAAWCPTCRRKMPALGVMDRRQRPNGVLTVASIYENPNFQPAIARDAAIWRRDHGLEFPVVADAEPVLDPYFNPFGRETYILISVPDMQIVHISQRFTADALEQRIGQFLEANPRP